MEADALGSVREITDLHGDLVVLVDLDVLEHYLRWDYLEALGVDGLLLGRGTALDGRAAYLGLHFYYYVSYISNEGQHHSKRNS